MDTGEPLVVSAVRRLGGLTLGGRPALTRRLMEPRPGPLSPIFADFGGIPVQLR